MARIKSEMEQKFDHGDADKVASAKVKAWEEQLKIPLSRQG